MGEERYSEHIEKLEKNLNGYAKFSFDRDTFLDGGEIEKFYHDKWNDPLEKPRIINRTPLQIERDRILYSNGMRKLTEKYHILYHGNKRIVRNYTTHTMRMAQVTRAICRGLKLNEDFGEAIALGAKIGALPFIHVSKEEVVEWMKKRINNLCKNSDDFKPDTNIEQLKLFVADGKNFKVPTWIDEIKSKKVAADVKKFMPISTGYDKEMPYSSGQQGYWALSCNPFSLESHPNYFVPETMYGIWKHSLGIPIGKNTFHHKFNFEDINFSEHSIDSEHVTYECIAVQYADDITWAVENLNDANQAALMNDEKSHYDIFHSMILGVRDIDSKFVHAIKEKNPGLIYTYFIHDFIRHSQNILTTIPGQEKVHAIDLIEKNYIVGMSEEAKKSLEVLMGYLKDHVFKTARVSNRNELLKTISRATMDILYEDKHHTLEQYIKQKSSIENWNPLTENRALEFLSNKVYKIQLAVNIFSDMGDHQIFEFLDMPNF